MKQFISSAVLIIGLFSLAAVVSAQANGSIPTQCPSLTQNMQFGASDRDTDGEVTQLQRFLSDFYGLDPREYVTGYFGRLTRENVRRFQCERMQLCSGSEDSNGYGRVGPATRAAIARICSQASGHAYSQSGYYAQSGYNGNDAARSCAFDGRTVAHGASVTAYMTPSAPEGACIQETRTCMNGVLSGSYAYGSCTAANAVLDPGCYFNGVRVEHGQSVTAYEQNGNGCRSEQRTCTHGALSGSYPESVCAGQQNGGSYAQSAYYAEGSYYSQGSYGGATSASSCVYQGVTYTEGQSVDVPLGTSDKTALCDNGVWTMVYYDSARVALCENVLGNYIPDASWVAFGCGERLRGFDGYKPIYVDKRHGSAPLTITVNSMRDFTYLGCKNVTFSWGDDTSDSICSTAQLAPLSHTYSSPGTYTITKSDSAFSARIRVDAAGSADANSLSQLAAAVEALQSLVQHLLAR